MFSIFFLLSFKTVWHIRAYEFSLEQQIRNHTAKDIEQFSIYMTFELDGGNITYKNRYYFANLTIKIAQHLANIYMSSK